MNRYLSLFFLYNRACRKGLLVAAFSIPIGLSAVFLIKTGNVNSANSYMLMEHSFGGVSAVVLFLAAVLISLMAVANSFTGRKSMKVTNAITGYTFRRLRISPTSAYLAVFAYCVAVILLLWGIAIASLSVIGKVSLMMADPTSVDTGFALGILRTEIGHALIPVADPALIIFNILSVLTLSGECAKACYLSWHNGRPSFGVVLVIIPMFIFWMSFLEDIYMLLAIVIIAVYYVISFGDVIFREKHPKGDPFKANQFAGVMDMDSFEFDDSVYAPEANSLVQLQSEGDSEKSAMERYGRTTASKGYEALFKRMNPFYLRRRFMPLGFNLERANALLGISIFIGIGEHLLYTLKLIMNLKLIESTMKGVTVASGMRMPYFWDLQSHTYYGYVLGIMLALFLQAYWNYEYYNKKTKSVYVMKRLPDRNEYIKTIWIAPAAQAVIIVVIMFAHTAIDFGLYVALTPDIALAPDYLSHILPF